MVPADVLPEVIGRGEGLDAQDGAPGPQAGQRVSEWLPSHETERGRVCVC